MTSGKRFVFPAHHSILDADPSTVIVTLWQDLHGVARGSIQMPPIISHDFCIKEAHIEEGLLAPVAILRAVQTALNKKLEMSVVDPQGLWNFSAF